MLAGEAGGVWGGWIGWGTRNRIQNMTSGDVVIWHRDVWLKRGDKDKEGTWLGHLCAWGTTNGSQEMHHPLVFRKRSGSSDEHRRYHTGRNLICGLSVYHPVRLPTCWWASERNLMGRLRPIWLQFILIILQSCSFFFFFISKDVWAWMWIKSPKLKHINWTRQTTSSVYFWAQTCNFRCK